MKIARRFNRFISWGVDFTATNLKAAVLPDLATPSVYVIAAFISRFNLLFWDSNAKYRIYFSQLRSL